MSSFVSDIVGAAEFPLRSYHCPVQRGLCNFTLIDVKGLRSQKYRDTRGRTVDEYRSVLPEIDRSTILGKRDYAICRLLCDNALRRGEIVSLDRSSFIPQESKLMILGKGT
jgi:integrase/recombinase XerC